MTSSMEHVIELLEYLPDEVRKKCMELQKLDLLHEMKGTKLKEDSTAFFASLNCLAPFEREKQHKELQQRHQEIREIADAKIQIAEYLQSAMEKYQERVIKDLIEFKTELESDNQAEVEIIEKTFMRSVTNPNTQNDNAATGVFLFNDDDSESASGGVQESILVIDQLQTANANGNCQDAEATPRSHLCQQRLKQQPYEDFKIPSNFRRPSQSVDSRGSLPRALDNEDIFDAEYSPSIKRSKPLSQSRQVAVAAQRSTKNSREASPHSSISSSSPRSTPPLMSGAHSSKHSSLHSRFPSTESSLIASTSAQQGIPTGAGTSFRIKQEIGADQQQQHLAQARQSVMMKMPSFAGPQASRHGRPRKLTKKVEQMLISNRTKSAAGPSTSAMMQRRRRKRIRGEGEEQLDEIDEEEFEEEEEYEGEEGEEEEADDRAWCYCKQGSAGNMVACDNKNCPYEWFHYECVGITQPPRGTWHCPTCSMKINATNRSRSASFDQAIQ